MFWRGESAAAIVAAANNDNNNNNNSSSSSSRKGEIIQNASEIVVMGYSSGHEHWEQGIPQGGNVPSVGTTNKATNLSTSVAHATRPPQQQ